MPRSHISIHPPVWKNSSVKYVLIYDCKGLRNLISADLNHESQYFVLFHVPYTHLVVSAYLSLHLNMLRTLISTFSCSFYENHLLVSTKNSFVFFWLFLIICDHLCRSSTGYYRLLKYLICGKGSDDLQNIRNIDALI